MRCSDGEMRDLVTSQPGAGWDYAQTRHPYHMIERPLGPHYCLYNRRHMAVRFDAQSVEDGYWMLRQKAAVLHTGELPLQFKGPDAERLLDRLFTKDITKVRPGRCGYGLACYEDGGLIVDGVLLRLEPDLFWYAQADGDFYSWARAHGAGMDVEISDPDIFASQVQGPEALNILAAAAGGLPDGFTYFGIARVDLGGQEVVITRTGYTNELGWEFYTEPQHDAEALWAHIKAAGAYCGLDMFGLDSMNIRRIEAGILNAGSDFDLHTTPFEAGLGRFVDFDKGDFIGKAALVAAERGCRSWGIKCVEGEPLIGAVLEVDGDAAGVVTAGAVSPYLGHGIGIALMDSAAHGPGTSVRVGCRDGVMREGALVEMPFYDKECLIPRGKLVDVPVRA
ncbi:Aminomethyltransferase (glycine cleavage system T protein) [Candidatus Rhodobacter oscarellae]|uniref:Aminomethyltransferase (Glycine cleavage system T protein) n=1 Tax=Candidatus Rhodobacter oscarellae TaxID=1675527 RepID=A0A0J9E8E5_9RHOB|nr:aminomethyltransferase family protein [Candidatus Rhodobacter lobularis]KMW58029.1 Aminomethyltransferase (glycine cleavage system T protein) [Candidatus Rhodobacter lobularis]